MKYIYTTLIALFLATAVNAQTSTNTANVVSNISSNTNVQQAIVSILMGAKSVGGDIYDVSKSAIVSGVDLIKSQAPELVTEFLRWKFTQALIWSIFGLIVLIGGVVAGILLIKKGESENEEGFYVIAFFTMGVSIVAGLAGFLGNIFTVVQIWVAPKVYLIEYVIDVLKHR